MTDKEKDNVDRAVDIIMYAIVVFVIVVLGAIGWFLLNMLVLHPPA
jgi:hypothetical protein